MEQGAIQAKEKSEDLMDDIDLDKEIVNNNKSTISKKQYAHLARAREVKKNKALIKAEKNKIFHNQLVSIHQQLGIMSGQMNNIVKLYEECGGGTKRKRENDEVEEVSKVQKTESNEKTENVAAPDGLFGFIDPTFIGKFIGITLAAASLYGYKSYMIHNKNQHPSEYLYKDIN